VTEHLSQLRSRSLAARNASFRFTRAAVVAIAAIEAPNEVTSDELDDQLALAYEATGLRPGVLFRLAGIDARRWWNADTSFDEPAVEAGRKALAAADIGPGDVDVLVSSSVSRHHLEPSSAAPVHHRLGLSSGCLNFDVSNACLGFLNSMYVAANLIDSGAANYVLIVNSESSRQLQEATVERLKCAKRATEIFDEFASLTLGSGAAAMVMGRHDLNPGSHRLVGGVARAGTDHHALCVGDLDMMRTDSGGLLTAGIDLVERTWLEARPDFDWDRGADHYVIHQVSKVHTQLGLLHDLVTGGVC